MNRREFLQTFALSSLSFLLPGSRAWALNSTGGNEDNHRLIVILLRGAMDGLNVVAPYADPTYYAIRPKIALPPPGSQGGLLDLDGHFGLNPAAAALMPLWKSKSLAFVHASGSPDATRSHFQAQDYMESGTPGKNLNTGWLNRMVATMQTGANKGVSAVSLGAVLPRICSGPASIATISSKVEPTKSPLDNPKIAGLFQSLYGEESDPLSQIYAEGIATRAEINKDLSAADMDKEQMAANQGAPIPRPGDPYGRRLANLIVRAPSIRTVFLDFGGWDTHANENGALARHLQPLASGLADLAQGLGSLMRTTTIVVMSEFGRTAAQNINNGTDHGHGNVMFLLGGNIPGGKVYGRWGGLSQSALYEGRDLPTTTDFRSVLAQVLDEQMQVSKAAMGQIFPGFRSSENVFVQA
jgi:uncharacterized protein (DUF1501 family)